MRSTKLPSWIEHLVGLDPRPVPPHVFSLGEDALRYARLAWQRDQWSLAEVAERALPLELFTEGALGGVVRNPGVLRGLIDDLAASVEVRPAAASLVLPDRWLRLVLVEAGDLPRGAAKRAEALAWRLRRLLPFRIEDLRFDLDAAALNSRPQPATAPASVLAAFALEPLLDQLEGLFAEAGIVLGRIINESVAIADHLLAADASAARALLLARRDGYSLLVRRGARALLYRYKSNDAAPHDDGPPQQAERDLRISLDFLREQEPGIEIDRVLVVAADQQLEAWCELVGQTLGAVAEVIDERALRAEPGARLPAHTVAPLVGAALEEIA